MQKIKPLKRFGQNYLFDANILSKIVDEISPGPQDNLIEIGPGLGSLTERLITLAPNLTAVEVDTRVIEDLSIRFPCLNLIHADFLKIDLDDLYKLKQKELRIVGNIPYNLTSPILFKMIEANNFIKDSVLMVQLEVAKRLTARKGTKDYGILAVLLQHFAEVKLCFKVSPNVFYPKPNVDSAIIHLRFRKINSSSEEKNLFIQIVKAAFGNRRKTLKNSLSNSIFTDINFSESNINLSLRAEQLDENDFVHLTDFVLSQIRNKKLILKK